MTELADATLPDATLPDGALRGNARGRRSRTRLLEAAADCFGEHGYSQTRIADITAAAGMSQGGFYRHFRDKSEILVEALREPLDALLHATALEPDQPPDEQQLIASNTAFFAVYAANRKVLRVIREAAALHEPGLVELWLGVRGRYVERIEAWLNALIRNDYLQLDDIRLTAEALGAVLDQMAYTRLAVDPTEPPPGLVEALGRVTGQLWYRALRAEPQQHR